MILLLVLTVVLTGCLLFFVLKSIRKPRNYPPGPKFTPWMGNTLKLRKEAIKLGGQYKVFEKWSQEYKTNILGLKLGSELVVVALSHALVREVHRNEVFEGRPNTFFLRLRTMGTRLGITCTDGKLWHEHRNFAMKQLRHVGYCKNQMEQHIQMEANSLTQFIEGTNEHPVWPGSFLAPSVINVLWSLTAGKRIDREDRQLVHLLDLLNKRSKVFDLCGGLLTQFPWLRFIFPNRTGYNLIQQLNRELHCFFMETIEDHKKSITAENNESDFIYVYIKEMQKKNGLENTTFNETQMTMTILDFFIAGSQTTSNTIDLAIMMLAYKKEFQQRIHKEITDVLNNRNEKYIPLSSRSCLPLLDAYIMEIQRFFHIVPISGPRRALWDTKLGGYNIPKNTTILIGLQSVLMDKDHWRDPENFRPERFIDDEGKIINDEYFIPFGQGRRRCLGDALARSCLFSFLVAIVQRFRIEYEGVEAANQLQLLPGITLSPKPYKVRFIKRNLNPLITNISTK